MISVIIPTLNAERQIGPLLDALKEQSKLADEIIVVDSESDDNTLIEAKKHGASCCLSIDRNKFDHGQTRDMALRESHGDIVVFMTQDALPLNSLLIEKLVLPVETDKKVAVSTARQIPYPHASLMEKLVRTFNYPDLSCTKTKEDIPTYGIKCYFCSDVCAAYRRELYEELGGFEYPLKTNEDMFFAAKAINNGYKVAYTADAQVYHSHDFTLREQYRRNYIQGYELQRHANLLGEVSQESEGMRLVKDVSLGLLRKGRVISFIRFGIDCCARYLGNKAGRKAFMRGLSE